VGKKVDSWHKVGTVQAGKVGTGQGVVRTPVHLIHLVLAFHLVHLSQLCFTPVGGTNRRRGGQRVQGGLGGKTTGYNKEAVY
jgi:hypothetical protein